MEGVHQASCWLSAYINSINKEQTKKYLTGSREIDLSPWGRGIRKEGREVGGLEKEMCTCTNSTSGM